MQMGFYFDQTSCISCYTCVVACKDWHDIPAGPVFWRKIIEIERNKYPNVFVAYLSLSCGHCAQPACIAACPVDAIIKRETDGVVLVNHDECLGKADCGLCLIACPYEIPQFGPEDNAKLQMCNMCIDKLLEKKKPICVEACPMQALDAGPMDELKGKYGEVRHAEGFAYSAELEPSLLFKPKRC